MNQPPISLAILYADICDSVRLYDRVGDAEAHRLAEVSMGQMTQVTERLNGTVIRTQGDGIMATFPSAVQACEAAREMQEAHAMGPVTIKVGFNFGTVIPGGGDVYGDAVNMAARIMGLARAGEILTTEQTLPELAPEQRRSAQLLDQTTVKGKSMPIQIYTLVFEEDELSTRMYGRTNNRMPVIQDASLSLEYRGQQLLLKSPAAPLVLGRSTDCQLIISHDLASRRHAIIEPKRDHFILTDQSTNGTYVSPNDSETFFLKRDSARLVGKGVISLGYRPEEDSENLVRYALQYD